MAAGTKAASTATKTVAKKANTVANTVASKVSTVKSTSTNSKVTTDSGSSGKSEDVASRRTAQTQKSTSVKASAVPKATATSANKASVAKTNISVSSKVKEKTHTAPQLQNRVGRPVENTSNPCYAPAKGLATGTVNAIDNVVKGVGTTILHPVETVKNVATAVTNPIDTTKAIAQDIKQTIDEKIIDGDTQSRFEVVGEVATSALLGATVASAVKAGSVVSKVDDVAVVKKVDVSIESGNKTLGVDELVVSDTKFLDIDGKIDWEKWAPNGGRVPGTVTEGQTLPAGTIIDRYGNPYGKYTSPAGVPYEQRALPYIENPKAYHRYEVLKPIDNVTISQIAEAFDKPGGGIQYELPNNIRKLIKDEVIKEIK